MCVCGCCTLHVLLMLTGCFHCNAICSMYALKDSSPNNMCIVVYTAFVLMCRHCMLYGCSSITALAIRQCC